MYMAVTIVKLFGRIEDIAWPRGDTKFLFERVKYFSTSEEKFRISKRPCNFLFIYKILTTGQKNAFFPFISKTNAELEAYSQFFICITSSHKCLTARENTASWLVKNDIPQDSVFIDFLQLSVPLDVM